MDVDLFIKKLPQVVKELIAREAFDNRRSINQEAIALLEEALVHRVAGAGSKRKRMEALLNDHFDSQMRAPADAGPQTESGPPTESGPQADAGPPSEPGSLAGPMPIAITQPSAPNKPPAP